MTNEELYREHMAKVARGYFYPPLIQNVKNHVELMMALIAKARAEGVKEGIEQCAGDAVRGEEAKELRAGLEAIVNETCALNLDNLLVEIRSVLDSVDARDSLAYLESNNE